MIAFDEGQVSKKIFKTATTNDQHDLETFTRSNSNNFSDESGCEADMAEGSVEEDNGDMLGPTSATVLQPPAPSSSIKDEESECESSVGSPEPGQTMGVDGSTDLTIGPKQMHNRLEDNSESSSNNNCKMSPNISQHLNGTMAGLVTLQNLQNLANLQHLPQVASLAAGLNSIANLSSNAPLNLSVSASATPRSTQASTLSESPSIMTANQSSATNLPSNPLLGAQQQPAAMPQLILASGQLVQGIQGAQLLIPTSQGLATQTILTIPVNHVNSTEMVNLAALNNGQVMQSSLANLQAIAQNNLLNNSSPAATVAPSPVQPPTNNGAINANLLNPLSHLLSNPNSAQLLQNLPQLLSNAHTNTNNTPAAAAAAAAAIINPLSQPLASFNTSPQPQQPPLPSQQNRGFPEQPKSLEKIPIRNPSPNNNNNSNGATNLTTGGGNRVNNSSNGEISISTSHGGISSHQSMKRSPASLSPSCNDNNSTADLLIDSPNQPTINQTNSNVVDGINLDEIKDFAKAFKLRRLSLGLTQTQVGQALSVTEGPAYSQSAICSALASQMFAAAQISSQQQAMFEKLDITPKSAQKIKPVLERWMKEAEERYKSGQNHLTDFIGIEPSKKRKRRTSFTPQALELLNAHFERNTHPSGTEITGLAHQLGYEREVIRIWFCNKRQALKNTVRMMSKGMV